LTTTSHSVWTVWSLHAGGPNGFGLAGWNIYSHLVRPHAELGLLGFWLSELLVNGANRLIETAEWSWSYARSKYPSSSVRSAVAGRSAARKSSKIINAEAEFQAAQKLPRSDSAWPAIAPFMLSGKITSLTSTAVTLIPTWIALVSEYNQRRMGRGFPRLVSQLPAARTAVDCTETIRTKIEKWMPQP
jgi:hypothetical protein